MHRCRLGLGLVVLMASSAWGWPYSKVVSFGDSLSDTGNVYTLLQGLYPPPPYYEGRFSNGPVWLEEMAVQIGLTAPTPNLSGGTNYSWGGAETGGGLSDSFTPNLGRQVDSYVNFNDPDGTELITLWGGGNDFLNGESDPSKPVTNIHNHITDLAEDGVATFLVPNLPPLGKLPSTLGSSDEAMLNQLSIDFNGLLAAELEALRSLLGVEIFELDVYGFFEDVLANPETYGFTNVTEPAYNEATGDVVPNPDEYLFWDSIHPTTVAHAYLGQAAAVLVPEPGALITWALVMVTLSGRRQRRELSRRN